VIADRGNALAFAAFGDAWTAPGWRGLPVWQLYLSRQPPDAALLRALRTAGYQFLVIDERMVSALPQIGFYITAGEPARGDGPRPPPPEAIARYERLPWAIKIYQTDHLAIYRLDLAALSTPWQPPPAPVGMPLLPAGTVPAPTAADAASPPGWT
jgi:hypothetical protein